MTMKAEDYTSQPPPGFRFRPTDEELVGYYLFLQQLQTLPASCSRVIAEVDLYTYEPWDLPELSHQDASETEWYFFCSRERKWAHGCRANRATHGGFWKATGKDRVINIKGKAAGGLLGMKKTIVFHEGRAPQGKRTPWIIHEYRLEEVKGKAVIGATQHAWKDRSWVLCKLFRKDGGTGKKQEMDEEMQSVRWEEGEVKAEARESTSDAEVCGANVGGEDVGEEVKGGDCGLPLEVAGCDFGADFVWDWEELSSEDDMSADEQVTCVSPGLNSPNLLTVPCGTLPRLEEICLPQAPDWVMEQPIFVGSPGLPTPMSNVVYLCDAGGEPDLFILPDVNTDWLGDLI
eukprot:TRINITY_DN736_c0_g2_i1.p2 TRINITY_DN736_c0_g2~~TRINITY_DN736_c0_g2_i1.p2  ORF type:complete len:346 (-),score=82.72 TRINITY_DN736_c0_g2_i1:470-1507(-)